MACNLLLLLDLKCVISSKTFPLKYKKVQKICYLPLGKDLLNCNNLTLNFLNGSEEGLLTPSMQVKDTPPALWNHEE